MKPQKIFAVSVILLTILVLMGCGSKGASNDRARGEATSVLVEDVYAPLMEMPAVAPPMESPSEGFAAAAKASAPDTTIYVLDQSEPTALTGTDNLSGLDSPRPLTQMIIKNAEVRMMVADSDVAVDGVTQIVRDMGGYIISSRLWYQEYYGENYKYATLTLGVPVEQFETALRRLRNLALRVLDETASGEDVTDQYVDLQSQVQNLEATRDRIRSFLDQAKTVDEALRINQQLSEVERQIEELKGRMNYLSDRSAFSTITVTLEPKLPEITPTPTATLTPTPTPKPWDPGETIERSRQTLVKSYQGLAEFFLWLGIVLIPIVGPWIFLVWLLWWFLRRKLSSPPPSQS